MKKRLSAIFVVLLATIAVFYFIKPAGSNVSLSEAEEKEGTEKFDEWIKREMKLMGTPRTHTIPRNARLKEFNTAATIPLKGMFSRGENLNTYISAGPANLGGRCRVVEYDVRYNGTSNQVVLAGGVNGGVFKSTDGGNTWTWKATTGYNSVTTLAQDPRGNAINPITGKPFSDTWYLGTGEFSPTSFANGSFVPGYGMYVSDDNGDTWQPLAFTQGTAVGGPANDLHALELYDMINKIVIDPVSGALYVSRYAQIIKMVRNSANVSTNSAFTRTTSFTPDVNGGLAGFFTSNQVSDVAIRKINSTTTKVYVAYYGTDTEEATWAPGTLLKGVWESSTGNENSWVKIGDPTIYASWAAPVSQGRLVMAFAPSNQNILYVLAENQIDNTSPSAPEADLYKIDMTTGSPGTYAFTNLSFNMPNGVGRNFRGFQVQQGYNMSIAVKPDNPNIVFIGGTNAYRSTDGFATAANVNSIGGYQYTDQPGFAYPNTHPDVHWFSFQPGNPNVMLVASDGGINKTLDVTEASPTYSNSNNNFQTYQFYYVSIDPVTGQNTFIGGAQDNSCSIRNSFSANPNNYFSFLEIIGGDGTSVGISNVIGGKKYVYLGTQNGTIRRAEINPANNNYISNTGNIKPSAASSDFVTYFYLNPDNTEDLYYTGFTGTSTTPTPKLYRTTAASTVTSSSWTDMTATSTALASGCLITSLATTRGTYNANHNLFIGTDNGRIFRLKDPRNTTASTAPTNISPTGTSLGTFIDIAVNPRNDDTLIAVVSNYETDAGADMPSIWFTGNANAATPTWTQVQGNIAPFSMRSCEIVVKNTGVEFYVGTTVGLYSTTSLNSTSTIWVKEGAGTPLENAIVSSLALRPSDNTLLVGTHGNGMFYASIGNVPTSVNDPIRNDKNFIQNIWPTVTNNSLFIKRGTLTGINKLDIRVFNASGQLLFRRENGYTDQTIDVKRLAAGSYFISVASSDYKYQTVQQFIKQ